MTNPLQKIGKNRFTLTAILLLSLAGGFYSLLRFDNCSHRAAFSDAANTYFCLLFFTFILQRIHSFYHSRSAISVVHLSTITAFSLIIAGLSHSYGKWVGVGDSVYLSFLAKSFYVRWFFLFLLLLAIVQQLWIDKHLKDQHLAYQHLVEKERQLARSEISNLQQQFQPHFLFNSLNSISALVKMQPEKAREMIYNLSDFLRKTIQKGHDDFNTLKDELAYLELYLSIEKVRFGERLQVFILAEETAKDTELPALLLQPLLENAIKYGLNGSIGTIQIRLEMKAVEDLLEIAITNPYDPTAVMGKGTGFGLKSVERKLGLLYKRADLMQIKKTESDFTVRLKIPQT